MMQGLGFDNNQRELQNWAADWGADTLLITSERGGFLPETIAEAFKCAR